MARVLGESARYVSDQAIGKFRRMVAVTLLAVLTLGIIAGILLGSSQLPSKIPPLVSLAGSLFLGFLAFLIWKCSSRKLDTLENERLNMRRGAVGETVVALILNDFPDDFYVINDLTTDFGNLDHVVVGPTGVFLIDTKNWRGIVSADGKGELLCNGRPTDKPTIRPFVTRLMNVKEKVRVLAPGLDPYFQAVFVFTSARVDARWGKTGGAHCIRDDQLFDYIVEKNFGKKLTTHETNKIAQAFLSLAKMDVGFNAKEPVETNGDTAPAASRLRVSSANT